MQMLQVMWMIKRHILLLIISLEEAPTVLFQWFHNNILKSIPDNCHLLKSSNEGITVKIGENEIENECEKLLNVKLDWMPNS